MSGAVDLVSVVCPKCQAPVGASCRTSPGGVPMNHRARVAPAMVLSLAKRAETTFDDLDEAEAAFRRVSRVGESLARAALKGRGDE